MQINASMTAAVGDTDARGATTSRRRSAAGDEGSRSDRSTVARPAAGSTESTTATATATPTHTSATGDPTATDHRRVVAIDGGAAAGKTTVARLLADRIGATLFDTGVLYRAVTLVALRAGVAPCDEAALATVAAGLDIRLRRPTVADGRLYDVILGDEDVTWALRDPAVEAHVSEVSAHRAVRRNLLPIQRRIAAGAAVVMVGRDVGTVVVPDAGVKVFLATSLEERAQRRWQELRERGKIVTLDDVLAELRGRDAIDSGREVAPLRAAADATIVETDGKPIEAVVAEIERLVRAAWSEDEG